MVNNDVAVINGTSNTLLTTIPVGLSPQGLTMNASGSTIYVADYEAGTVTVISLTTPVAPTPTLSSVAVSPSTKTIAPGGSVTLTATPACSGGACPARHDVRMDDQQQPRNVERDDRECGNVHRRLGRRGDDRGRHGDARLATPPRAPRS